MKRFHVALCILLFWRVCKASNKFNNIKCDRELNQFDAALEKRELWALKCEFFLSTLNSFYKLESSSSVRYMGENSIGFTSRQFKQSWTFHWLRPVSPRRDSRSALHVVVEICEQWNIKWISEWHATRLAWNWITVPSQQFDYSRERNLLARFLFSQQSHRVRQRDSEGSWARSFRCNLPDERSCSDRSAWRFRNVIRYLKF